MARHSFSTLPSSYRRRVKFKDDWDVTTSMSLGKLYPIYCEEVVPGDDFHERLTHVSRLTSSYLRPVMDDVYLDTYAFFVPGRILYDGYESVFGNPKPSAYVDDDLGSIPTLAAGTVSSKSVADYLGLPVGRVPSGISVLPFRAFAMIYNEWFRNENTDDEVYVQTGELADSEVLNNNAWSANNYMGQLPSVGKIKDYFTSAVPQPQKGAPVSVSALGALPNFPVITASLPNSVVSDNELQFRVVGGGNLGASGVRSLLTFTGQSGAANASTYVGDTDTSGVGRFAPVAPSNLVADTSGVSYPSVTVDELRLATQKQLMLIADTMYGSRYREYIYGHYGVSIDEGTVQVPEYLCGKRIPLNVSQVAQTTTGDEDNTLGSLGGYSYTVAKHVCPYFKGFKEHGYVIWVGCLRQRHSYQQGVRKFWTRTVRDDFYDPLYSHIGYQPIYSSELFVAPSTELKGDIFGWQEAWSEYKHSFSAITGEARSNVANSLDVYHFADVYGSSPVVGSEFNKEVPTWVDRTLSVPSTSQDQFIVQFHCSSYKTRVMPVYCEPGYMDHWNK